jgi:predicted MFS family arabinose efflux permease
MHREAIRLDRYDSHQKLIFRPEDRMRENAWLASLLYPCGLIWYGWTSQHGLLWIIPMLANFFFGFGSMIVFGLSTTMLTEFMPKQKSSGVAINNFVRNIFSCVGGVVAQPLIRAIGNGWLFTGLGIICLLSCMTVVWAMKKFGPRWRLAMDEKLKS